MLHKKSIIFALFHKYTVCFAWVAAWVEKQTVFLSDRRCGKCCSLVKTVQFLWFVQVVVCLFLRGGSSVFLRFYRFLVGTAVLRRHIGLFSVPESRYCRE